MCVHCSDIIMRAMVSLITGVSTVCSTVCSGADQRKHQSSASLAFVTVDCPHIGQVTRKYSHLMTSSCHVPRLCQCKHKRQGKQNHYACFLEGIALLRNETICLWRFYNNIIIIFKTHFLVEIASCSCIFHYPTDLRSRAEDTSRDEIGDDYMFSSGGALGIMPDIDLRCVIAWSKVVNNEST